MVSTDAPVSIIVSNRWKLLSIPKDDYIAPVGCEGPNWFEGTGEMVNVCRSHLASIVTPPLSIRNARGSGFSRTIVTHNHQNTPGQRRPHKARNVWEPETDSPPNLPPPCQMSAALARLSLFIVATTLQTLSVVPPNPTPDDAYQERFHKPTVASTLQGNENRGGASPDGRARPKKQQVISRIGTFYFPYAFITSFWILLILEIPRGFGHEGSLGYRLVLGASLTALGSVLRLSSFKSLGRNFTYELAILPSHTLATTGPYAYVRHPSYTALPFIVSGCALCFTSQGTMLREWIGESGADGVVLSVLVGMVYVSWLFVKRAEVEDQALKEAFGKEWEEWARVVRYRFIPGLY